MEKVPDYVELRHRKGCAARDNHLDPACTCVPSIRGAVYVDGKKKTRAAKGRRPAADRCAEAHRWAAKQKEYVDTGRVLQLDEHTVRSAWEQWYADAESGRILSNRRKRYAKSSLVRSRAGMDKHTLPALGHLRLTDLTPKRVRELATDLRVEANLSASSVANCIMPLSTVCFWAVQEEMLEINPCIGLRLEGHKKKDVQLPTFEQQAQLLDVADAAGARVLWALALYAGARRGEALGLQWDMVDLDAGTIRFTRTWNPDPLVREFKEDVKTRAGDRPVPMVGPLAKILKEHRLATGRAHGFVFSQTAEDPWDGQWPPFYQGVRRAIARAKLPTLTFHDLRHVYASRIIRAAAESGEAVDWHEVAMLMGHTSVAFTMDKYAHLVEDYLDRHRKYQDEHYRRHSG